MDVITLEVSRAMTKAKENRTDTKRPLDRLVLRPGLGWEHLAGPVWDHTSGARIHTAGIVRLPDKTHLSLYNWRENELGRRLVRINGGNKKRGLMAWAVNLLAAYE